MDRFDYEKMKKKKEKRKKKVFDVERSGCVA
jgi:hypothetical protein